MNRQIEYLNTILSRIERIQDYVREGQEAFFNSPLIQDAVLRNFEVIGEISRQRLSSEVKSLAPQIQWRQIGDFRNALIHEYDSVDLNIVWNAVIRYLPELKTAVLSIRQTLTERDRSKDDIDHDQPPA
jgi:uncharacterized protein with HEPN domain